MTITPTQQQLMDIGYGFEKKMLFFNETGEVSDEVWDVLLLPRTARYCTGFWTKESVSHILNIDKYYHN